MPELHDLLDRRASGYGPPPDLFERVLDRRSRRERTRRVGTTLVALAIAAVALGGLLRAISSGSVPATDPRSPFLGTWVSIDYRGTQTMTIRASEEGGVQIEVNDDGYVGGSVSADVCSGAPLTITGVGRFRGSTELVIPSPVLTCVDGSGLEPFSPPVDEALRDLTFVHHPEYDTLTGIIDEFVVWTREGAEMVSGGMWPQSSLEVAERAQRLADAGDPRYPWQVDREIFGAASPGSELFARFLRDQLGWEEFRLGVGGELSRDDPPWEVVVVRCALGGANPLYPNDPEGRDCAPTIDEHRYETVYINADQPVRNGASGIWVVMRWMLLQPSDEPITSITEFFERQIQQAVPPPGAEAAAVLRAFLQARVDGEGAEEYLHPRADDQIPLPYATSSGAPYERSEFELVQGPVWPGGWMEFKVRLFAEDGTVVEQPFVLERREGDGLGLVYGTLANADAPTTENGEAIAERYEFLDGEITFAAAPPWRYSVAGWDFTSTMDTLTLDQFDERVVLVADPLPVGACHEGPAPADALAMARSIGSDPDLETTEPVAVSVGGIQGSQVDVVAAPGATPCEGESTLWVMTAADQGDVSRSPIEMPVGHRMRLYLLDLPEGMSARILAIAISAPEASFEQVVEAATPIVDSFVLHAR